MVSSIPSFSELQSLDSLANKVETELVQSNLSRKKSSKSHKSSENTPTSSSSTSLVSLFNAKKEAEHKKHKGKVLRDSTNKSTSKNRSYKRAVANSDLKITPAQATDTKPSEEQEALTKQDLATESKSRTFQERNQTTTQSAEPQTVSQVDALYARQSTYLDNMKRHLDLDIRERKEQLRQKQLTLRTKEQDLAEWESLLLAKEKDLTSHTSAMSELQKLEQQLEDKEITLRMQAEELDRLKEHLAKKEELLIVHERELRDLHAELSMQKALLQQNHHTDLTEIKAHDAKSFSEFFEREKEKLAESYYAKIQDKHAAAKSQLTLSASKDTKQDFTKHFAKNNLLSQIQDVLILGYEYLSQNDVEFAKQQYAQGVKLYSLLHAQYGHNQDLRADLLKLYNEIQQSLTILNDQ